MSLKESFYVWRKKCLIKLRGRTGNVTRFTNILILCFSLFLFLLVLCPTLFNRMPFYDFLIKNSVFPYRLNLEGHIIVKDESAELDGKYIEVCVGGFSTTTSKEGDFELEFIAEDYQNIPIVFLYNDQNYIFHRNFDNRKRVEEFIIHVE